MAAKRKSRGRRPFHIVHISDLHLTARDDAKRSEIFPTLTGMNRAFRTMVKDPKIASCDCLLVTGDVTDRGDLAAWKVFWDAIDAGGLRGRTLVIPGNHDVCSLSPIPRLQRKGYAKRDLDKARAGLAWGGQETAFPWARLVDSRVVIFGVNSNNLGNWNAADNALGEIGYNQLAKLARLLRKHQDVPVKIVALHHSPNIPLHERSVEHGAGVVQAALAKLHQVPQEQRRMLRLLCIAHAVRLVAHGHLHRKYEKPVDSVRIVGVPAATQKKRKQAGGSGYPFVSYIVRGNGGRVDRKWDFVDVAHKESSR